MPKRTRVVIGGVATRGRTHHAAAIDQQGRLLGDWEFPADRGGYRELLGWLRRHGDLDTVGVEGTGTYGAGLTRFLLDRGVTVVEVDRPDRRTRRQRAKSDPIDAEAAARAVLAGTATAPAKRRDGIVEAIRRCGRCAAVPSRLGPRRSTSSKACWSPPRHRCGRRWRAAPPRRRPPPAPGCAPTRPRSSPAAPGPAGPAASLPQGRRVRPAARLPEAPAASASAGRPRRGPGSAPPDRRAPRPPARATWWQRQRGYVPRPFSGSRCPVPRSSASSSFGGGS